MEDFTQNKAKRIASIIKKFSPFLEDFSYNGFSEKNSVHKWIFTCKFPQYIFRIFFVEKNGKWCSKIFVYWKKTSKDMTMAAGKDFDYRFKYHSSFSELILDMNRKIINNPIMGNQLYHDDFEFNMDKEAIPLILKLKDSKEKLFSIDNDFFDDLKKIYNIVKNIPNEKLLDYCRIHNKSEADKQDFILDLQKIHKLDYYIEMKKIGHIL